MPSVGLRCCLYRLLASVANGKDWTNKRRQFESWRQIAGFEAPETAAAGLRHVVFENRGSQIHEGMLVKLDNGMSADDYMAAVKSRSLFPRGALDYSGPGSNLSWSHH